MPAFAAYVQHDGPHVDAAVAEQLARGLKPFGSKVETSTHGRFACMQAYGAVGARPSRAVAPNNVCVVAMSRFDARAALSAAVLAPPECDDAGLLLLAYAKWGSELLSRISGDFAFVLWDAERQTVLAATDQFGSRPLFYTMASGMLLLSDSLAALRDTEAVSRELNEDFIGDFLCVGYGVDPNITVYSAVRRVPAGHRLSLTKGAVRIERYYRVEPHASLILYKNPGDYAEQFRELLLDAVGDRLPGSGPIGILMSGGLDSTAVAAAICHHLGPEEVLQRVTAFTTVFKTFKEEEGPYAQRAAEHLGMPIRFTIGEDYTMRRDAGDPAWCPVQPGTSPQHAPAFEAAMALAPLGGTLFSGLAGDVLLTSSTEDMTRILRAESFGAPLKLASYLARVGLPGTSLRDLVRRRRRAHLKRVPYKLPPWISTDFARRVGLADRMSAYLAHRRQAGLANMTDVFWSNLLSLGASSLSGLTMEARHPFLDTRLIAFAARLPAPHLRYKRVLRDAMASMLPSDVIRRPKTLLGQYSLANRQDDGVQARAKAAIANSPKAGIYMDLERLRRSIESPQPDNAFELQRAESLAIWLQGLQEL